MNGLLPELQDAEWVAMFWMLIEPEVMLGARAWVEGWGSEESHRSDV